MFYSSEKVCESRRQHDFSMRLRRKMNDVLSLPNPGSCNEYELDHEHYPCFKAVHGSLKYFQDLRENKSVA